MDIEQHRRRPRASHFARGINARIYGGGIAAFIDLVRSFLRYRRLLASGRVAIFARPKLAPRIRKIIRRKIHISPSPLPRRVCSQPEFKSAYRDN